MSEDHAVSEAISLRPAKSGDEDFLLRVFSSTREREHLAAEWTEESWSSFIGTQSDAQRSHYRSIYPDSEDRIILCGNRPVGRMWVSRAHDQIRFLDIDILPAQRGRGIGTHVIRGLQEEARRSGLPLRHSVELENPRARSLYERLGFVEIETRGLHTLMEWRPFDAPRDARGS